MQISTRTLDLAGRRSLKGRPTDDLWKIFWSVKINLKGPFIGGIGV